MYRVTPCTNITDLLGEVLEGKLSALVKNDVERERGEKRETKKVCVCICVCV